MVKSTNSVIDVEPFHSTITNSVEGEDEEELLEHEGSSVNGDAVRGSDMFRDESGKGDEGLYMERVSTNFIYFTLRRRRTMFWK